MQSHLLGLTDILVALSNRMEVPNSRAIIQPIVAEVLEHQKWVLALLSNALAFLATNAILMSQDLAISTVAGQVPKETLRNLRSSPLLGNLMFHVSADNIGGLKKPQ